MEPFNTSHARWGAIFCGALICFAIQLLLTSLGAGIGLSAFSVERGETPTLAAGIGAGIFSVVTVLLAFFVGGYAAAKLANQPSRVASVLHGLTVWGLVSLSFVFVLGRTAASTLGAVLQNAGIGLGATTSLETTLRTLDELKPRVVTDMSILKGKAVTELVTKDSKSISAQDLAGQEARQTAKKLIAKTKKGKTKRELREVGGIARKTAAGASWLAFGALLGGGAASAAGAVVANRRRVSLARERQG